MTDGRANNGGRRPGAGRRPSGRPVRDASVTVAVHREQREMWTSAAEEAGVAVAEAVREQMDAWAAGVLAPYLLDRLVTDEPEDISG